MLKNFDTMYNFLFFEKNCIEVTSENIGTEDFPIGKHIIFGYNYVTDYFNVETDITLMLPWQQSYDTVTSCRTFKLKQQLKLQGTISKLISLQY